MTRHEKNSKKTKRALCGSLISLLLCVALLTGSTVAWFTDSVKSGENQILAGNLDIDVEYSTDGSTWNDLEGADSIFSQDLWEPGHTEVAYLRITNKGTLSAKYQMGVNPYAETSGTNVNGESFQLSDYLVFNVIDQGGSFTPYANRAAARSAAGTTQGLSVLTSLSRTGSFTSQGETYYAALVVYMPETVGNEANYKTGTAAPTITLGITVAATQLQDETDSFGNDYDAAADGGVVYPFDYDYQGGTLYTATPVQGQDSWTLTEANTGLQVVIPNAALKDSSRAPILTIVKNNGLQGTVVLQDASCYRSYDISTDALKASNTEALTVILPVDINVTNVSYVKADGSLGTDGISDVSCADGKVTFKTTHFCEYVFASQTLTVMDPVASGLYKTDSTYMITSEQGLKNFRDLMNGTKTVEGISFRNATVKLAVDVDLKGAAWTPIDAKNGTGVVFDGQGHTVKNFTVTGEKNVGFFGFYDQCSVKDLNLENVTATGINHVAALAGHGVCMHIDNCSVKNAVVTTAVKNNDDGDKAGAIAGYLSGEPQASVTNCTISDCTIQGYRDCGSVVGIANGGAAVTGNNVARVLLINDRRDNYQNYTADAQYNFNDVAGRTAAAATVSGNSVTGVTYQTIQPEIQKGATLAQTQTNVDTALAAAKAGDIITLPKTESGESLKLTNVAAGVTVKGDGNTQINATGSGSIASMDEAILDGLVLNLGNSTYHGFHHSDMVIRNCTINGMIVTYAGEDGQTFENCTFNQTAAAEYNAWAYGKATFRNCTFNNSKTGKFVNVYNEVAGAEGIDVIFDNCTFNNTSGTANKAAVNVKGSCGATPLNFQVVITNCRTTGAFPASSKSSTLIVYDSVVQLDDIIAGNGTKITLDGVVLYPEAE